MKRKHQSRPLKTRSWSQSRRSPGRLKKNGASHRTRTDDLLITNELLYQLS